MYVCKICAIRMQRGCARNRFTSLRNRFTSLKNRFTSLNVGTQSMQGVWRWFFLYICNLHAHNRVLSWVHVTKMHTFKQTILSVCIRACEVWCAFACCIHLIDQCAFNQLTRLPVCIQSTFNQLTRLPVLIIRACDGCGDAQYRRGCNGMSAGVCTACATCQSGFFRQGIYDTSWNVSLSCVFR